MKNWLKKIDNLELVLFYTISILFPVLIYTNFKTTYVPLGNYPKLIEAMKSKSIKNNHAIFSLYFLNLDSDSFATFQREIPTYLSSLPLRQSIYDFRIQNLLLHSLAGTKDLNAIEETLKLAWTERIQRPYDDAQKVSILYTILKSNNVDFAKKWQTEIEQLNTDYNNNDVQRLSDLILKGPQL